MTTTAFVRDNGDGTQTVVVPGIRAEGPSMDGGPWTEDEVWTVTAPVEDFDGCGLGNSVHGITWMRYKPRAVIHRERYATHPLAAVDAYWDDFERMWGFWPSGNFRMEGWPFGEGREWVNFVCRPEGAWAPMDERALLKVAATFARRFGTEARIYPYDLQNRKITGPLGDTTTGNLLFVTNALARLGK
ncbi:hypothetical protein [Streptomyces sp. NPDC051572]|uniref:hypothetical protein n=1 Tax=Streptomyces sp. NPDC051572 TaxID=3155802 RepID=UPI00344B4BE0